MLNWTMDLKVIALGTEFTFSHTFQCELYFFFFACPEKFDNVSFCWALFLY